MTEICSSRTLTQDDFDRFARLSGDDNPIHVDPVFAAEARFGRTVAHGVFLIAVLRALAGQTRPTMRLAEQSIRFPAPARVGDRIDFAVAVDAQEESGADFIVKAMRAVDGEIVCEGRLRMQEQGQ